MPEFNVKTAVLGLQKYMKANRFNVWLRMPDLMITKCMLIHKSDCV
jgi:hypothetical protein